MARIGLIGPSYTSESVNADCQMTMNWIIEKIESDQGKSGFALYRTPGLALTHSLGTAGVRGMITAQGRTFAVAGPKLWELFPPSATPVKIDRAPTPMVSDGQPVSMASGSTQVLIASAGNTYVFDLNTNLLTDISATLGAPVAQVGYSDGFFLALFKNSNKIQSSTILDASSWPGANFTGVSVFTDNIVGFFIDHRELWVYGPKAIQPYWNSGNFPFPFDIREGAFIESGLAAPFSPAKADSSIFWVEGDDRGNGIVRRANGYSPVRISTHAIEQAFSTYPTIADAVGMTYKDKGHEFYQLTFPSARKTWVYDTATGMWHERGFWDGKSFTQHRAQFHAFNYDIHLVGDPTTGAIYQMSRDILDDFGNPIRRVRRSPHISVENQRMFHSELEIDLEAGIGPAFPGIAVPTLFYLSDANGVSWRVAIDDLGDYSALQTPGVPTSPMFMNAQNNGTSWKLSIIGGVLTATSVSANPDYLPGIQMVSQGGGKSYLLYLNDLGGGFAQFATTLAGNILRGPQLMMRYSDDRGHTWSNERIADCGQPGEYRKRIRFTRLGSSRDRVYEISVSDPSKWAIIDGYLKATGYTPQERMTAEMRKRA